MAVKVAINGFGRIGRLAFRQMFGAEGTQLDFFRGQCALPPESPLAFSTTTNFPTTTNWRK